MKQIRCKLNLLKPVYLIMNIQQAIDRHLEDSNFPEALSLYQKNKANIKASSKWYLRLAKVYYSLTDYDKVVSLMQLISLESPSITYEARVLDFKANYLLETKKCRQLLDALDKLTLMEEFTVYHRKVVKEFQEILDFRQKNKSKVDRKSQGIQYERLAKEQSANGAESLEGFPLYLISRSWFTKWKKYVYLTEHELQRSPPGPITQFQIMDHPYNIVYDPLSRKDYTNKFLMNPADYNIMSKKCWDFLSSRYQGIPIIRYNICNFDKTNELMTEVSLKCMLVALHQKMDDKFLVQISRRETWKGLQEKVSRAWGKGRLWGREKGKNYKISSTIILEEEQISGFQLVFQRQVNGRWTLGDQQPQTLNKCAYCGKVSNLKFCQCKKVKYCSEGCLYSHRSKHQRFCDAKSANFQMELTQIVIRYDLNGQSTYQNNKGVVGLRNIGNSCYMNTGLQCLSNMRELTEYFQSTKLKDDLNSSNPLGSNGYLACAYARLIRDLWSVKQDDIPPWEFKRAFCKFSPQFSGFGQHDSQEFINTLLDGLHEDINLIKNKPTVADDDSQNRDDETASRMSFENYSKRNKSFISDLIVGQFKSTVRCPQPGCGKIAINFDPFMIITLPIPQAHQLEVFFVPKQLNKLVHKLTITLSSSDIVETVSNKLARMYETSNSKLMMIELSGEFAIVRTFNPKDPATTLLINNRDNYVFCYETKVSDSQVLYTLEFYDDSSRKQEITTFPRFHHFTANPDQDQVKETVWKGLSDFNKNPNIYRPSQLFRLEIGSKVIKVILKQNIKLRTYKDSKNTSDIPQQQLTIKECFELFCQDQKLDQNNEWYCNKCKVFVRANKKMDIYRVNKILIIGFKRFKSDRKIKSLINYPHVLDLSQFILSRQKDAVYELFAVVNHFGSLLSGHYTAYCKNYLTNKWYEFNDARVTSVRQSEIISKHAYVLFYRLKN